MNHLLLTILLLLSGFILSGNSLAQNYSRDTRFWQPNSIVNDIVIDSTNSFVYIGGSFQYVGPPVPHGAILNSDNEVLESAPSPNGTVHISIPDGFGGWYIGGDFTKIGTSNRLRIAHIDSSGNLVDSLGIIGFSETVRALNLNDSILFVGGDFVSYGNTSRDHLAAIDITTNSLHSWNPAADWRVTDLLIKDSLLFVVGGFGSVANSSRNGLAVFNLNDLSLHPYVPNHNGNILCAAIDSSFLYLGGTFSDYDNQSRNRLAKIDITNFSLQPWNPNANHYVFALAVNDSNVFIGGNFTQMNGMNRVNLANVDKLTGQLLDLSFSPDASWLSTSGIYELAFKDSFLLVGANYNAIFYDDFKNLFAVNLNTGIIDPFFPHADGPVNTISFSNQKMYVGGEFASAGGNCVDKIARFDLNTGKLTRWRSKIRGTVSDFLLNDSILVAVGYIPYIDQSPCGNVALLRTSDGLPVTYPVVTSHTDPFSTNNVKSVEKIGDTLIISGEFNLVNGQNRNQIAGVRFSNGALLNWSPNLPNGTGELAVSGNHVYTAGSQAFRFSKNTLVIDADWQFTGGNTIHQIVPFDTTILLLGEPYGLGNIYHTGLTILDTVTGSVLNEQESPIAVWNAGYVNNNSLFLAGIIIDPIINPFAQFKVYEANKISRDTLSGPFPVFTSNNVTSLQKFGSKLFLGGFFSNYNGQDIPNFVVLDVCEPTINPVIEQAVDCNSFTWIENNITYYESGIYSDLLTNSVGCDSVVFLNLHILRDSILDNQTYCSSYTWINGVTYTASNNTDFVNYTNNSGCDSTIWLNLTILPYPVAGILYNNGTLAATGTGTYQWLDCSSVLPVFGATNALFTPSQNGIYAVIVDNGYCSDTSDCITITDLGIDLYTDLEFTITPNPTNDQIHINFSGSDAELTVYDVQGKVVLKDQIQNQEIISLENLKRGVYLFDFKNSQGHSMQRIIKQ